jgi:NtrC-family two-component system sensor histidine kinase KinB
VIDDEGNVSSANPRAVELRALVDDVLRTSVPDATVDLRKAITVGTRRLLPRIVPIAERRGKVLVLSDVTELARLDEMRLELVAVASHELRTPLTTMRMTLSMLRERAATLEARDRELVETALVGVDQLSLLVDEFLDLTRIEAGQLDLQWARVSLRELVARAVASFAPACEQARIAIELEQGELSPSIAADPNRLAMVVSNLLANAVEYTPAGGRVVVRTSEHDGVASIEVADSGPGVPVEYRERVFERFFRVQHASDASAGAGIGLYIARQVTEAHDGTIRCGDSALGGASFVMTIPLG